MRTLRFAAALSARTMSTPQDFLPIAIQTLLAVGFVVGGLVFAAWLGPKRQGTVKNENFECGVEQFGNARSPFSVKYFLIAILFVLFDVEIIFLYPWAVNFKELGMAGFVEMVLFIGFVLAGFYYVIRKGALKWDQ
jgi:NADH-quinone oxidoreductase subunit A